MRIKTFPLGALWDQPLPSDWLLGSAEAVPSPGRGLVRNASASLSRLQEPGDVELLDWQEARAHWGAWSRLGRGALEGNVFVEPGFTLTAVHHVPVAQRPSFVFAWVEQGGMRRDDLLGVFGLHIPPAGAGHMARMWCSPMMALGTPLLARADADKAVEKLHTYISREHPHIHALLLPQMSVQGPVARTFERHATTHSLGMRVFDRRQRAVVTADHAAGHFLEHFASSKKQKELRRQRRRLSELGRITYTSARRPDEIRDAMERFLALEASGWKGNQSSALLSDPSSATFARAMSRHFAQEQACWIDALELDGTPIAMGIMLVAGDVAFYWKTAYDERFARYSPGVLFSIDMTIRAIEEGTHELINSCAVPNHPMIDHIWRERIEMGDMLVQTHSASASAFSIAAAKEAARRRMRAAAKNVYYSLLGKHVR